VPVRIYFPKRGDGPFPVLVLSSGIGAGRASFEFLGRHLASHGFLSVHVQHPGSDAQIWQAGGDPREAVKKVWSDPQTGLTRLLDLVFVLDRIGGLATSSPVLRGRIDLKDVAAGGMNLGAWTALAAAGLGFAGKDGEETSLPDPRVKAALLIGPPAPGAPQQRQTLRFEHIQVPCLHLAGTLDDDQEGDRRAAGKRFAFDRIAGAEQVLVLFRGGAARLAGRKPGALGGENDPALKDYVKTISTAFLAAHLRHDAAAGEWIAGGGLAALVGMSGSVETRPRQAAR
jgi:predicted dienelactone hydrolase